MSKMTIGVTHIMFQFLEDKGLLFDNSKSIRSDERQSA